MNRRVRNRTHGGVGGRRARTRLLPDCQIVKLIKENYFAENNTVASNIGQHTMSCLG